MDFRTTIHTTDNQGIMHHSDSYMMLGSCFSDNMGNKLRAAMVDVDVNPFGTIYNPYSIATSLERLMTGESERGIDLFEAGGVWNSYHFHSRYSLPDKQATLEKMNARIADAHQRLATCNTLIITLGTAVVYRLKSTGEVVANCHKVPQHHFTRTMASVDEMTATLGATLERLHAFNPGLRVIFTLSPIRHIADGLQVNSLSKASLRVTIDNLNRAYKDFTGYFPAYEIMLDDLRDYRYFDDASTQAIARCERVTKRLNHRPMSSNREVVERFNADTRSVVRNLAKEYPYIKRIKEIQNILSVQ